MRVAVAQLNYHIGNFDGNYNKMYDAIKIAKEQNADIICFSELATCGYPPRDFLEFDDFINQAENCIQKLLQFNRYAFWHSFFTHLFIQIYFYIVNSL